MQIKTNGCELGPCECLDEDIPGRSVKNGKLFPTEVLHVEAEQLNDQRYLRLKARKS